jgi:hypothetical protein
MGSADRVTLLPGTSFKVLGTTTQFSANTAALPLGTYTYGLTCSSGPTSVTQSVAVTIEDNPAYATLTVANPTTTYTATPADYVTINWISNLTDCTWNSNPAPTASVSSSASTVQIGQAYTISWTSTGAASCTETGGGDRTAQGNIWLAGENAGTSGSMSVSPNDPGQFTFGITCLSIDPNVAGATAQTVVAVTQASAPSPPSGSTGSSSHGGGGAVSLIELSLLSILLLARHVACAEPLRRRRIRWEKRFNSQFVNRHIVRGSQRRDRREQVQLNTILAEGNRQKR